MSGNLSLPRRQHPSLLLHTHDELERQYTQLTPHKDLFEQLLDENDTPIPYHTHTNPESPQTYVLSPIKELPREEGCKCSKIGCLKLYCVCFSRGKFCTPACACSCCSNTEANHAEVQSVRRCSVLKKRQQLDPSGRRTEIRCSCRQSGCSKRYCQCFKSGVQCGADCSCVDCGNCGEIQGKGKVEFEGT